MMKNSERIIHELSISKVEMASPKELSEGGFNSHHRRLPHVISTIAYEFCLAYHT